MVKNIIMLKVVKNKRNGQATVSISKKKYGGEIPDMIGVIKKDLFYKNKGGKKSK